ncbi:MAG TPA: YibE/F family protein, partial [Candidatus Paceibacterota bacterium]|nr:YibE/F family protein [Candidatus Paceibacterota bacterium]
VTEDTVTYEKAQVVEVESSAVRPIAGTPLTTTYQTIRAKMLEGKNAGHVIEFDNDYLQLKVGDVFYAMHTVNSSEGINTYAVSEPYRLPIIGLFIAVFLACLFFFGGIQGVRGLVALGLSFFFIVYLLLPGILHGYPPVAVAVGVAALIVILGSYITHGFNRTTTTAVLGLLATVVFTGILAFAAVHMARLSGFSTEESVYLNFDTSGTIDFAGLLLGSILIGTLGILYDAAIGQAIAVEELIDAGQHLNAAEIYRRALRIGREHIGALVNTLAIAYVGAALPLLLLFKVSYTQSIWVTLNQEVFATEIVRILVGATGIILAVPITTAVAVWMLHGKPRGEKAPSLHHHH